jgi:hypothetical protein
LTNVHWRDFSKKIVPDGKENGEKTKKNAEIQLQFWAECDIILLDFRAAGKGGVAHGVRQLGQGFYKREYRKAAVTAFFTVYGL